MIEIVARDMYAAQGFTLSDTERAELIAKANRIREILGQTTKQPINVSVVDHYGAKIGYLTYSL